MSASLIGWMITLFFIIILVSGFFVGFWRGLKRSTLNLVISFVGLIVAFFITPSITNAILGINVSYNGTSVTLENLILQILLDIEGVSTMIERNPNLEVLVLNLPKAIATTLMFIVLTIAVECVIYIIYKVFALTLFRVKKDEPKHHTWGGVVGLAKTFVITIVAVMPLASLIGLANNVTTSENYGVAPRSQVEATIEGNSGSYIADSLPDVALEVVGGLENNLLIKMSGLFGLDNAMFDYYSGFDIDGEKIYIRRELENASKILDFGYQLQSCDMKNIDYSKIDYDKVTKAVDSLTKSTLFKKVLSETLADMIVNYKSYSFLADNQFLADNPGLLTALSESLQAYIDDNKTYEYFRNDLLEILCSAKTLGQSGVIDQILSLENLDANVAISVLTSDDNIDAFEEGLTEILNANLVRASITTLAEKGLEQFSDEFDAIGASTSGWTEEDWQALSVSVTNVMRDYGDIASEVDVLSVIKDPSILLDENENYNIALITAKLGSMIDNLRSNKLLRTVEDKPIVDKMLSNNNISLPAEAVINGEGEEVTITNYSGLFEFLTQSLVKIRDEGVYDIINSEGDANAKVLALADLISGEGKSGLLSEILLPLYQVEPTKSLIIDNLTTNLESELFSFGNLTNYDEWKSDLGYISTMLINFNGQSAGDKTFLSLALEGNIDGILDAMTEDKVESTILPILYAESTAGVRDKLFESIKSSVDQLTSSSSILTANGVTFDQNNDENQAVEVCEVIKKMLAVNSAVDGGATLKSMDKGILGELLNTMKVNSFRTTLALKEEEGIFKDVFASIMTKLKSDYQNEVDYINSHPDLLEELGVESLDDEPHIDYVQLLNKIEEIESQING